MRMYLRTEWLSLSLTTDITLIKGQQFKKIKITNSYCTTTGTQYWKQSTKDVNLAGHSAPGNTPEDETNEILIWLVLQQSNEFLRFINPCFEQEIS